jgi:hypothetical protein
MKSLTPFIVISNCGIYVLRRFTDSLLFRRSDFWKTALVKTLPFADVLPNVLSTPPPRSLTVRVNTQTQLFHDVSMDKAFDLTGVSKCLPNWGGSVTLQDLDVNSVFVTAVSLEYYSLRILGSHLGCTRFESWLGFRAVFSSFSRRMIGQYIQIRHCRFFMSLQIHHVMPTY